MLLTSLNWNDLKFFLIVARNGSLAKAAARLSVTHSTVFRRIQRLENELGMKLFARVPEGYQLTSSGYSVLEHVEKTANDIDVLLRFVENQSNDLSGEIKISVPNSVAYNYLPKYIAEFCAEYPDIKVNLMATNTISDLSRNEADLAIRVTKKPPENLIGHHLFCLKWSAFAATAYIDKHGMPETLEQLQQNHLLIAGTGDLQTQKAFSWIEKNIDPDNIVYRCNDILSMSKVVETGLGICLLPDDHANPDLHRLFVMPNDITSDIWVLMHPDLRDCQRINLFRKHIINRLKQEPALKHYAI